MPERAWMAVANLHERLEDSWMGPVAMQNILWLHLFDKMLRSLPQQQVGLYLMENQGWERIFYTFGASMLMEQSLEYLIPPFASGICAISTPTPQRHFLICLILT